MEKSCFVQDCMNKDNVNSGGEIKMIIFLNMGVKWEGRIKMQSWHFCSKFKQNRLQLKWSLQRETTVGYHVLQFHQLKEKHTESINN